ncbi:hypothetical protein [Xylanibacter rodentium]|uniref:Uncharacterized protein n=1 Tax=Xylanibacter rodentium TaxID=2736289 RepID=A0ABX2AUJ8_9BACT|nr:hypothetical protein [Xylanibacter rodentium]NPE14246.1 hypothetical protein [Xylanibacter rodentium]NPE39416.1 hypothetical protein [Prevotella sp. PCJ2]
MEDEKQPKKALAETKEHNRTDIAHTLTENIRCHRCSLTKIHCTSYSGTDRRQVH